jgi:serine/threonine protein kinase
MARKIDENEDIKEWINLQQHSNIVTAFDTFFEETTNSWYAMVELTNAGNMYQYISSLNLNLGLDVTREYRERVFDVAIQLATALDFAHNARLIHGKLDLSAVVIDKEANNLVFKIQDFAPGTSMKLPISPEATYWPFSKGKKDLTNNEKLEVLMLKDIYSLGICILEMMIGRTSKQKYSISLSSLPLTWADFPESTALI